MSYMDQPPVGGPPPMGGGPMGYSNYSNSAPMFTLASWGKRLVALLIDGVISTAIIFVGVIAHSGAVLALLWLVAIAFQIWNLVVKQGTSGQSIGKGVMGIRVVKELDAQPMGIGLAFGRWLMHSCIDPIFYLGYLWPLWDSKKQTWGDKVCHTVVVEA